MGAEIYKIESYKAVNQFVGDLAGASARRGFFIHNESKMEPERVSTFAGP